MGNGNDGQSKIKYQRINTNLVNLDVKSKKQYLNACVTLCYKKNVKKKNSKRCIGMQCIKNPSAWK